MRPFRARETHRSFAIAPPQGSEKREDLVFGEARPVGGMLMGSWERLVDLIDEIERAVSDVQTERRDPRWETVRDVEAGWYSRGYLAHRLPAEIVRSQRTGRPCGLGLLRLKEGDGLRSDRWGPFLAVHLDPVEVAVSYSEREVLFLFPELEETTTRARLIALADAACLAGLASFSSVELSWTSYPKLRLPAAALLARLEKTFVPLDESAHGTPGEPDGKGLSTRHRAGHGASEKANGKDNRKSGKASPAQVETVAGRTYPISFWLENRRHEIRAVLDEFEGAEDDRRFIVLTDRGVFRLEGAGQRWLAQKVE